MYTLNISKLEFLLINILIILIFGFIYKKYGNEKHFYFVNKNKKNLNSIESIYFSANTYITLGNNDIYPKSKLIKSIILTQIFILMIAIIMLSSFNLHVTYK